MHHKHKVGASVVCSRTYFEHLLCKSRLKLEKLSSVCTAAGQKHSIKITIIKMRFALWSNAGRTIIVDECDRTSTELHCLLNK